MLEFDRKSILVLIVVLTIVVAGSGLLIWKNVAGNNYMQTNLTPVETKSDNDDSGAENNDIEEIYVHITGGVKEPGVYRLKPGSRVIDVVNKAGGQTEDAREDNINLAAAVIDGEKIYLPVEGDEQQEMEDDNSVSGHLNINQASREQLQELPGIGPTRARSIIEFREKLGGFTDINQLLEVKGIGEKTLSQLKEELSPR